MREEPIDNRNENTFLRELVHLSMKTSVFISGDFDIVTVSDDMTPSGKKTVSMTRSVLSKDPRMPFFINIDDRQKKFIGTDDENNPDEVFDIEVRLRAYRLGNKLSVTELFPFNERNIHPILLWLKTKTGMMTSVAEKSSYQTSQAILQVVGGLSTFR